MLRKLNLLLASLLLTATYGFSQSGLGTIRGTVKDRDSKEPIYQAKIAIKQNGTVKGDATTDFDGKFQINSIAPGSYDIEVSNPGEGYQPLSTTGVIVSSDRITFLDDLVLGLPKEAKDVDEVVVVAYRVPLIQKDGGPSGGTVTREDIARLPVRSAAGVASTVGGVNVDESSGQIASVRGSRSDGTYYYIDGIKVRGSSNLPKSAIEEVSVITGGLPANYGDATGGIISVTTRGPSAKYFGSLEGVTSGFYFKGQDPNGYDGKVYGLDKFAYNLVEGMISGPLLMQKDSTGKKTKPLLGFFLSGNYTDQLDSRPLNGGSYRVKKDVRDRILANPLLPNQSGDGGVVYATDLLRKDDFEKVDWRMNARNYTVSASGKIDVNTGPTVNLTFGGSMNFGKGSLYSRQGSLLNFTNFGENKNYDWRVYGRFTQRFSTKDDGSSKIKSAFYSIMVDYSKSHDDYYDPKHQFNLFNYGHVGKFEITRRPTYILQETNGQVTYVQDGTADVLVQFTPSETNPELAAITQQYYNIYAGNPVGNYQSLLQIQNGRGLRNGDVPLPIYNIWDNPGIPYNYFQKSENDQFRVTGSGSVNIGNHSISLGFEYEQRWDRGWTAGNSGPIGLWQMARQRTNQHLDQLDVFNPIITDTLGFTRINYNQLNTGYAYESGTGNFGGAENGDNQSFFDYNLRKKLGMNPAGSEIINIDQYDPNLLQFDMFSPDELFNQGNNFVEYWGYDHTGKKVKGTTDIAKYFNEFDENGNYKRFIGAFQPIYIAGYAMDKFAFNDIVFNVGVRVDVFDANQPVLKDKYLLYTANTAAEALAIRDNDPTKTWVVIPESIGSDYVVYVNDVNNPTQINGFRSGDTWYNAQGIVIEDPTSIKGPSGISPWLKDPGAANVSRLTQDAFEDYKPQVNVMPRVAFSFPISDEASFFAHYDILTKRPTTAARFNPIDYQFIESRSNIINNPNLLPEQTIDYELGFQQVLTKTSSLKISAFYREQRNNVQLVNVFEAYPNTYKTYGNRDFGTVKGLTVSYDMRRTGNVRMTANYTLQFAEGTGSDANSAQGFINAGLPNLRNIFPYSYDQRHAFNISFDYRYGQGADYNGPMIGDAKILENTGLNILTNIYSGSPYSSQNIITSEGLITPNTGGLTGSLNGSRLPWQYRLDVQLDRTIELEFGKEGKKKTTFLNVYIRATNLLNQMNVLSVYRATGNWDDDGYLAAAQYQPSIQNQVDEQSFRDYYNMKIQNPFNISSPRTIRLGVKFDF